MAEENIASNDVEPVSGGTTATAPAKRPKTPAQDPKQLPLYKLLLHNDEVNTFDHVIRSVLRLTPIRENDATIKVIEAHESGVALLLVTHRERAELYVDQFISLKVKTSIEPE